MRPVIVVILLLIFCQTSYSKSTLQWHEGVVVLTNNEVLVGDVVIEPLLDVVLFRSGETRTFYPASKINFISIHDEGVKFPRKFISLQREEHGKAVSKLYEVVLRGELSVIRKPSGRALPDIDDVYSYDYFVMENASIINLSDFRKKVYPVIEHYYTEKELTRFLSKEGLNPSSLSDAIKIIGIYNDRLPLGAAGISARK